MSHKRGVETNLILGMDNGDGLQDGFEGTKCFGGPFGEIDDKCGTPESPVNPPPLLSW